MEGDAPGECRDGADNDRDGDFDCDDSDCANGPDCRVADTGAAPEPEPEPEDTADPAPDTGDLPLDTDGDGVLDDEDCAPDDPDVSPLAEEVPHDGLDNDCDPDTLDDDFDGDGILAADDCDEGDPDIGAGAAEHCWAPSEATTRRTGTGGFGTSLLVPGDVDGDGVDDIVVGAPSVERNLGAVALWSGATFGDAESSPLATWTGRVAYDFIGSEGQLAATGDLDGDGRDDLAVSFPSADPGGFANTGMVAILLTSDAEAWSTEAGLDAAASVTVHGRATADKLGTASTFADLDGDGLADLITTAPQDDEGASNGGTVFVFTGGLSTPGDRSANDADHRFHGGFQEKLGEGQLVVLGDVDGDGTTELAIGSGGSDGQATGSGVVYLLSQPTETPDGPLAEASAVQLHGAGYGDCFGHGIAALGDLDADGRADFVVGALQGDGDVTDAGSAYLFTGGSVQAGTLTKGHAAVMWSGTTGLGRTGARPVVVHGTEGSAQLVLSTPQAATGGHVSLLSVASAAGWTGGDPSTDAHTWVRSREADGLGTAVAGWNGGLLVGAPLADEEEGAVLYFAPE